MKVKQPSLALLSDRLKKERQKEGKIALLQEHLEIFFDGKTIVSADFRVTELIAGKQSEKFKTSKQEMGYQEEINTFINRVLGKSENISLNDTFISMQAAFAMEESLGKNVVVEII